MDTAQCFEDQAIYTAAEFSQLHPTELERMRRFLHCPECQGPAFFRNTSRNGRMPCFGARPHSDACTLASTDFERSDECVGESQYIEGSASHIVLDFRFGAPTQCEPAGTFGVTSSASRSERSVGSNSRPAARTLRRMSSILRTLIAEPAFGQSDQIIEIPQSGETAARDFFVPLFAVGAAYVGQRLGFWGQLRDARFASDGTLWLNSGAWLQFSFCLAAELVEEFGMRYSIRDEKELADAWIFVIGILQLARNGKVFCVIDDLSKMALRIA